MPEMAEKILLKGIADRWLIRYYYVGVRYHRGGIFFDSNYLPDVSNAQTANAVIVCFRGGGTRSR